MADDIVFFKEYVHTDLHDIRVNVRRPDGFRPVQISLGFFDEEGVNHGEVSLIYLYRALHDVNPYNRVTIKSVDVLHYLIDKESDKSVHTASFAIVFTRDTTNEVCVAVCTLYRTALHGVDPDTVALVIEYDLKQAVLYGKQWEISSIRSLGHSHVARRGRVTMRLRCLNMRNIESGEDRVLVFGIQTNTSKTGLTKLFTKELTDVYHFDRAISPIAWNLTWFGVRVARTPEIDNRPFLLSTSLDSRVMNEVIDMGIYSDQPVLVGKVVLPCPQ